MQSKHFVLSAAVVAAVLASSSALAVNHSASDGTIFSTTALTGFQTDFNEIGGTKVTVTFSDSSTEVVSWVNGAAPTGSAVGVGFSVTGTGDTFSNAAGDGWTLNNLSTLSIDKIEFNGRPGDTVWDRTLPNTGTPGSAQGRDLEFISSTDPLILTGNVNVLYSDAVKLSSNAGDPLRDLYSVYTITFSDAAGAPTGLAGRLPGAPPTQLLYRQDADNNRFDSPLIPVVPEASTVVSGLALAALGLIPVARRFRRA